MNTLAYFRHSSGEETFDLFRTEREALEFTLDYIQSVSDDYPKKAEDLSDEDIYGIIRDFFDESEDTCDIQVFEQYTTRQAEGWVRAEGVEPETVLTDLYDELKPKGVSFNRFSELAMNYLQANIDDILDLLEEEE